MSDRKERIINFDFQGWPEYKLSVRDFLSHIGAKLNEETNKWEIEDTSELDSFLETYRDDGMGYGVCKEYITEVNFSSESCILFRDKEIEHVELWIDLGLSPFNELKINDTVYLLTTIKENDKGELYFEAYKANQELGYDVEPEKIPFEEIRDLVKNGEII